MRILLHDYGRFPFTLQLARELARRGNVVGYAFSDAATERADVSVEEDDAPVNLFSIPLHKPLAKQQFLQRYGQEVHHGRAMTTVLSRFRPEVVLSANTPLDAQRHIQHWCRKQDVRFVYWLQDLLGIASRRILKKRLGAAGAVIGSHYIYLEKALLRRSDAVVAIADGFARFAVDAGAHRSCVHRIPNWAPLDETPQLPRSNEWSVAHGLVDKRCLIYSGTMGMKHDPNLIVGLAEAMRPQGDVRVVVISEGSAVGTLKRARQERGLDNLVVLPFQPYPVLPEVLASATVLIATLERSAADFCVPSKVLTYMCAARPMLLAMPEHNLTAQTVANNQFGIVTSPEDADAWIRGARLLLDDPALRKSMGANARRFAERAFAIRPIADKFESILGVEARSRADHSVATDLA